MFEHGTKGNWKKYEKNPLIGGSYGSCFDIAVLDEGEAILGIAKNYFMGIGAGSSGKIEYSDEFQFLEDNRVYTTKMYGMGRPKDNNSFQYLDISKLKPQSLKVEVTNTEDNPVNTKAKA